MAPFHSPGPASIRKNDESVLKSGGPPRRAWGLATLVACALALSGCGGSGGGERGTTTIANSTTVGGTGTGSAKVRAKLPPGAVGPVDTVEEAAEGPAATEASPESQAEGPQATGELEGADRSAA